MLSVYAFETLNFEEKGLSLLKMDFDKSNPKKEELHLAMQTALGFVRYNTREMYAFYRQTNMIRPNNKLAATALMEKFRIVPEKIKWTMENTESMLSQLAATNTFSWVPSNAFGFMVVVSVIEAPKKEQEN